VVDLDADDGVAAIVITRTVEVQVGAWPMPAQVPVARAIPQKAAIANVLTGIPFTARGAQQLGAVDEVVAAEDVDACARRPGRPDASQHRPVQMRSSGPSSALC
jgi:enoyl-CoA hydratase/carnithine racemase